MLWCLHGFLGDGSDWDRFDFGPPDVKKPSLFSARPESLTLTQWGKRFANEVASVDARPSVLGYSLGGRLALHALIARPEIWKRAVIIAAHLGLANDRDRQLRREADERWAERFLTEDWTAVVNDWGRQAIFGGMKNPIERREDRFDRAALAQALRLWSLGRQEELTKQLASVDLPVLWVVGEKDKKFVEQGKNAVKHLKEGELWIVKGCSHRVPWEAPDQFTKRVREFLS